MPAFFSTAPAVPHTAASSTTVQLTVQKARPRIKVYGSKKAKAGRLIERDVSVLHPDFRVTGKVKVKVVGTKGSDKAKLRASLRRHLAKFDAFHKDVMANTDYPRLAGEEEAGNYAEYEEDRKRRIGNEANSPHRIRYKRLATG